MTYYRAGAPLRSELAASEWPGTRIAIGGRSLVMALADRGRVKTAAFDFVLQRA